MIRVRPARPDDAAQLADFNAALARESEERELEPARLLSGVSRLLADSGRGLYFVAERDGRALGCCMLTREWSDWRDGWFLWLQSVYVEPAARGAGVFRALWAEVRRHAAGDADVIGLRLYVERDNARARAVYAALGLHETDYRLYEIALPPPE